MPPDNFWDGIAASVSHASGEIVCFLITVVALTFLFVRYYMPERKEQKRFEAEMQQKRLELEMKQQQDAIDVQRENIDSRARQMEVTCAADCRSNYSSCSCSCTAGRFQGELCKDWTDSERYGR